MTPARARLLPALILAACGHEGAGTGDLQPAQATSGGEQTVGQVAFAWKSGGDFTSGDITAQLVDGRTFTGTYLQLTATSTATAFAPYYNAWTSPGWGAPGMWYAGTPTTTAFLTRYSGQVLAHLRAPSGQKMRCQFLLKQPEAGLEGGAKGDCQLSTGESVFGVALD
jgi:hypothetical protein